MNPFDDPDARYWRRVSAIVCSAGAAAFIAGLAFVGVTAPDEREHLALNCVLDGGPLATVFDDGGSPSMCAEHRSAAKVRLAAEATLIPPPPPDPAAIAHPHPQTF